MRNLKIAVVSNAILVAVLGFVYVAETMGWISLPWQISIQKKVSESAPQKPAKEFDHPDLVTALLSGPALSDRIRKGGVTLFMRHFERPPGDKESLGNVPYDQVTQEQWKDCSWQSNITEHGRSIGKATGRAFRSYKFPITEYISSPFCRAIESGKLLMGEDPKKIDMRLTRFGSERMKMKTELNLVLQESVQGIRLISGHNPEWLTALAEGEIMVLEFDKPSNQFRVLGRVLPYEWAMSAAAPEILGQKAALAEKSKKN